MNLQFEVADEPFPTHWARVRSDSQVFELDVHFQVTHDRETLAALRAREGSSLIVHASDMLLQITSVTERLLALVTTKGFCSGVSTVEVSLKRYVSRECPVALGTRVRLDLQMR